MPETKTAIPAPRFLAGVYTVAEIAEIKGVTPGAIHRDLHRTRKGDRPGVVPAPDAERDPALEPPGPLSRVLVWSVDRADVQVFLADPTLTVWK